MTDSTDENIGEKPLTWLEQFKAFTSEGVIELRAVVEQGLQPLENEALIDLAAELVILAQKHDPDAIDKLLSRVSEHNSK
jgi:hypothetical protein